MINFNHMFNNKLIMWLDLIIWLSKFNTVLVLTTSWTTDPRCLAVHRGTPNVQALEAPTKTYYRQYLQQQDMTSADFKGVTLDDLVVLGQIFRLNVYVYDLQKTEAGDITTRLVRVPPTDLKIQWIWICMKTTSATSVIWRNTVTLPVFEMWPAVETCWDAAQTWTVCTGSVTSFIMCRT